MFVMYYTLRCFLPKFYPNSLDKPNGESRNTPSDKDQKPANALFFFNSETYFWFIAQKCDEINFT